MAYTETGIKDERGKRLFDNRRVFCICEKVGFIPSILLAKVQLRKCNSQLKQFQFLVVKIYLYMVLNSFPSFYQFTLTI